MRIGLVRHYKTLQRFSSERWVNTEEYGRIMKAYEQTDVMESVFHDSTYNWDACWSSDFLRAIKTAKSIYQDEIRFTPLLREICIDPIIQTKMKMPFAVWTIAGRLAWLCSHRSQHEGKHAVLLRVQKIVNELLEQPHENLLVVCHGALMWYLRKELLRRGFKGERFIRAENGQLYLFEKKLE